jgi:hypothetical protein
MPNWVEQTLHVAGRKTDVDRFIKTGFLPRTKGQFDHLLDLHRLCPLERGEPKETYTHDSAVVLERSRTKTQAAFEMITSWDYPARFYARLAVHWPTLAFCCTVNEEMGSFGGLLVVLNGEVTDLVEDYGTAEYSRRAHKRRIRKALDGWGAFLTAGRDWRLVPKEPWVRLSRPFDAHFDEDGWYYFRSRDEMLKFRARYGALAASRRVDGEWRRTR